MIKEYDIGRFDFSHNFISNAKLTVEMIEEKIILTYSEPKNNISYTVWDFFHHLKALEKLRLLIEVELNSLLNCSGCREDYNYRPTGNIFGQLHSANSNNPELIDCYLPTEKTQLVTRVTTQMESYQAFLTDRRLDQTNPPLKTNYFKRLLSTNPPKSYAQEIIETTTKRLTNLELLFNCLTPLNKYENLNIHIIQDHEDVKLFDLGSVLISGLSINSNKAQNLSKMILARLDKIIKQPIDLLLLDIDFIPVEKQEEIYGFKIKGYFESIYLRNNTIEATYKRTSELESFIDKIERIEKHR